MQVRHPSGPLNFAGRLDADNKPIPPGPDGNGGASTWIYTRRVRQTPAEHNFEY